MRKKDLENKVNELKSNYDKIARLTRNQTHANVVKNRLVRDFVNDLQENRPPSTNLRRKNTDNPRNTRSIKINPEIMDFVHANEQSMSFMSEVLIQENPAETKLRGAFEHGREIIEQLHINMDELMKTVNLFPANQQNEIYANIFNVVDVIEGIHKKFSYSKLSFEEKIVFDLDKKFDDLKNIFVVLAEEEGIGVLEQKMYYLDHPILKTNTIKMSPYAQELIAQIKEKQRFLKELLEVYKQDQEPEDVRIARREAHKQMLQWVEDATFAVKKDIKDVKGVKKGQEVPSPRGPGED